MTGGFAGGEAGLRQFVDEGEIKFREADSGRSSPAYTLMRKFKKADAASHDPLTHSCTKSKEAVAAGASPAYTLMHKFAAQTRCICFVHAAIAG